MALTNIIVILIFIFAIIIAIAFFYGLMKKDGRPIFQKVLWAFVACCAAGLVLSAFALLVIYTIRLISMICGV